VPTGTSLPLKPGCGASPPGAPTDKPPGTLTDKIKAWLKTTIH
jgi:hypothetical protein